MSAGINGLNFATGSNGPIEKYSTAIGANESLTNVQALSDAWGKPIPVSWGFGRVGAVLVWGSPYYKNTATFKTGTKFQSTTTINGKTTTKEEIDPRTATEEVTSFFIDLAYSIGFEGDLRKNRNLDKVRINATVVYDRLTGYIAPGLAFSIRSGRDMAIDPVMLDYPDTGKFWYPGQTYIVFDRFPLAGFGNALPLSVDLEFGLDEVGEQGRETVFPTVAADTPDRRADQLSRYAFICPKVRRIYFLRSDLGANGLITVYDMDTGERFDDVVLTGDAAALKARGVSTSLGAIACGRDAQIGIIGYDVADYFAIDLVNGYVKSAGIGSWLNITYLDGDETFATFAGPNFSFQPPYKTVKVVRVVGGLSIELGAFATPYPRAEYTSGHGDGKGNMVIRDQVSAYYYNGTTVKPIAVDLKTRNRAIDQAYAYGGGAVFVIGSVEIGRRLEYYIDDELIYSVPCPTDIVFPQQGGFFGDNRQSDPITGVLAIKVSAGFYILDFRSGSIRFYNFVRDGFATWDGIARQFIRYNTEPSPPGFSNYGPDNNGQGISLFSFLQTLYTFSGKYSSGQITNDGINDLIKGALITKQTDVDALVTGLCTVYKIEREITADGILFYRNRDISGALNIAARIPIKEMAVIGQTDGVALQSARKSTSQAPSAITLRFIDPDNEFKENSVEYRRPDGDANGTTANISLPIVMTVDEANLLAQAAVTEVKTLQETHNFRLPPKYCYLKNRDIIEVYGDQFTNVIRITQDDLGGDFSVTCEGETIKVKIGISAVAPALPPRNVSNSNTAIPSTAYIFDTPTLRIADDPLDGTFVQYDIVGPSRAGNWIGAYLSRIPAEGLPETVFHGYGPQQVAVFKTSNRLLNRRWITDSRALTGTLTGTYSPERNTDRAGIDADATRNLAWYGAAGRWEIIQFEAIAAGAMTGIRRGLRGTEIHAGKHVAGDIVVIPEYGIAVDVRPAEAIGKSEAYKAVSDGASYQGTATGATRQPEGQSLRLFAPSGHKAVRQANGDLALSWHRRDRAGTGWGRALPATDGTGPFTVAVLGANGATLRTIQAAGEAATYAAADQATDGTGSATTLTLAIAQVGPRGPGFSEGITVNVR